MTISIDYSQTINYHCYTMVQEISKVKDDNKKEAEQRLSAFIQDTFQKALESQKRMLPSLDAMKPLFDSLAEHANRLAKMQQTFISPQVVGQIEKMQQDMKSTIARTLQMVQKLPNLELLDVSSVPRPQPQVSEERIVELVYERIVDLIKSQQEKSIVQLPENAAWDDIEIKFVDDTHLEVLHQNNYIRKYSAEELGFTHKRSNEKVLDQQWKFLQQLSIMLNFESSPKPTIAVIARQLHVEDNTCEKIKSNLSKKLKIVFGIKQNPFHEYDATTGYRPMFTIKPETPLRYKGDPFRVGG